MKPFLGIVPLAAFAIVLVSGCAARPEDILAMPVSDVRYANMSCEQLRVEQNTVERRLEALSERQLRDRRRDGWLNALVIPGIGAATPDQEDAIAETKGEQEAIQTALERCNVG